MSRNLNIFSKCILGCGLALAVLIPLGSAHAKDFGVLYSFTGNDGANPQAVLIADGAGNLYGTTYEGGNGNCSSYGHTGCGTVFKLAPNGTETVLYSFTGGSDGSDPTAGLIMDKKGNLYSTTYSYGGADGFGVVFKLAPNGTETVLYSFTGGSDGSGPYAGLIMDKKRNLYSTTVGGGSTNCTGGCGTVFKLAPNGTETVLYSFTGGSDGANPQAVLIADGAGNLYSTTYAGGADGAGVVFKLAPNGTETVRYSFTGGSDGSGPTAGLIMDKKGNLYGTTNGGGADGAGVVFKLAPNGTEFVLYSFTGGSDGSGPYAGLIMDKKGNLYGTTHLGGADGFGVVFKLAPNGTETVLHSFSTRGGDGRHPLASLIMDKKGNLYSTTFGGGADNDGVVFKLKE